MTAPAMTQVEYEELIDRAKELEQPIVDIQGRGVPTEIPQAFCALPMAVRAATVLGHSAENAQHSLELFETTRKKLAQALRNAASAYLVQDEGYAKAISNDLSASGLPMSGPTNGDSSPAATPAGPAPRGPLPPEIDELHSLEQTALQLEQLDQGKSFERFAEAWAKYQDALREARNRFRPLKEWQGKAADAVNRNFEDHRAWLDGVVTSCARMADQAQTIVDEFPTLRKLHVISNRKKYDYKGLLEFEKFWTDNMHSGYGTFMKLYTEMAKNSETLLADFKRKAGLPLTEIYTPAPRDPSSIEPPPTPGPGPYPDPGPGPGPSPDDGGFQPFVPSVPSTLSKPPTGQPTPYDPNLAGALAALDNKGAGGPHGGGGIKPASFGGAMPLQPPTDEAARPVGAGSGAGNRGRGAPGAAGAMGAGMGGAPGQGGRGGGKGKRVQAGEEQSVYTEDREWTEGLIGRRRVKEEPND